MTALAGANIIYGLGMLGMGITFDYAKLVMDNEFAGMIKKVISGIPVNRDTLAVEVIKSVGAGGEFVSHDHTLDFYKDEQSSTNLIERRMEADWKAMGSTNLTDRAYEYAKELFNTYRPEPLSDSVQKKIRDIVNETEEHYGLPLSKE